MATVKITELVTAETPLIGEDLTFVSRSGGVLNMTSLFQVKNYTFAGGINGVPIGNTLPSTGFFTTFTASQDSAFNSFGALKIPVGSTAQRPLGENGKIRYNSTTNSYEGFKNGSTWSSLGGITYTTKTANYQALPGDGIIANTSGGPFTIILPMSPSTGDYVTIVDGADFFLNNLTIDPNGSSIEGGMDEVIINIGGISLDIVYSGSTWQIYTQVGTVAGVSDVVTLNNGQTLTNKTLSSPLINSPILTGGTINNAVIGNLIPSAATFTNLTALGIDNTPIGTTTPAIGSFTSISASGNLNFTGVGRRIIGDFSNGSQNNRVLFQSSIINDQTNIGAIPNGNSVVSLFTAFNSSDPTQASNAQLIVSNLTATIASSRTGTAPFLPLAFNTNGLERLRIDTDGTSNFLGDIVVSGGRRIMGDFSAGPQNQRTLFQTAVTNQSTNIGVIPNGTNRNTVLSLFNSSDPLQASVAQLFANDSFVSVQSVRTGTAPFLPLVFMTNGLERLRIDTDGNSSFSGTVQAPMYTSNPGISGPKYQVGDDAKLSDRGVTNTIFVEGVQDANVGFIQFGQAPGVNLIGYEGNNSLRISSRFLSVSATQRMSSGSIQQRFLSLGGGNTIDVEAANFFSKTVTSNTTFSISNTPASGLVANFILEIVNGGNFLVSYAFSPKWSSGIAPTLTTNGRDILGFYTYDGGVTWNGFLLGQDVR